MSHAKTRSAIKSDEGLVNVTCYDPRILLRVIDLSARPATFYDVVKNYAKFVVVVDAFTVKSHRESHVAT